MSPRIPDDRLRHCRVLVVEDVYFVADDIAAALQNAGAVVVGPVSRTQAALAVLASERVDAAVLDINLHGDSVYRVADVLQAGGTPFVFATGYGGRSIPAVYRDVKVWGKPFDAAALIRSLPELIAAA